VAVGLASGTASSNLLLTGLRFLQNSTSSASGTMQSNRARPEHNRYAIFLLSVEGWIRQSHRNVCRPYREQQGHSFRRWTGKTEENSVNCYLRQNSPPKNHSSWNNKKDVQYKALFFRGLRFASRMRWILFNLPNPSSRTMALGSIQPLTEMSIRDLPGGKKRPSRRAENFADICKPIV
jgi:hypothetical protein